jgi:hypothetical protein
MSISHLRNIQAKYQINIQITGVSIYPITDKNQSNIASGIVHVTAILAIGDNIDTCPKLNTIIGKVKLRAAMVRTNASLILMNSGKNAKIFLKNH